MKLIGDGAGGRKVLVGVKLDPRSRELLTWALVKVAEPGDLVIALHVLDTITGSFLSLTVFFFLLSIIWIITIFLLLLQRERRRCYLLWRHSIPFSPSTKVSATWNRFLFRFSPLFFFRFEPREMNEPAVTAFSISKICNGFCFPFRLV